MSVNKTWPISNFRSDAGSAVMGTVASHYVTFHDLTSRNCRGRAMGMSRRRHKTWLHRGRDLGRVLLNIRNDSDGSLATGQGRDKARRGEKKIPADVR